MAAAVITPAVVKRWEWVPPDGDEKSDKWAPPAGGKTTKGAIVSLTTDTGDYATGGHIPSTALLTLLGWTGIYLGTAVDTATVNRWPTYIPASGKIQYSVASTGAEHAAEAMVAGTCYMLVIGY